MPHLRPLLVLALALTVAACGGATPSRGTDRGSGSTSPSAGAAATVPGPTEEPGETGAGPSDEPVATEAGATEPPTPEPTASESVSESAGPSGSPEATDGPAAACSGNDKNREFYANVAATVDWTVLCAVLPKGWFVSTGSYRLANGGKLVIGYKGPSGATLDLSEGAFCMDAAGCLPPGSDGDAVPLGPMTGTFVSLTTGDYAIVVDRGLNPSWQLVTHGMDQATSLALGAALVVVAR